MSKFSTGALVSYLITLLLVMFYFKAIRTEADTLPSNEKTNLAIRQTAHQLYKIDDDHHSTIPPVSQTATSQYQLKLNRPIDYDHLPFLLDKAFTDFKIDQDYTVTIKSCFTGDILLGYNLLAFENKEISCIGRELISDCNILEVVFDVPDSSEATNLLIMVIGGVITSLLLTAIALRRSSISSVKEPFPKEVIQIGRSIFIPEKLSLKFDQEHKTLTFREAKLLRYLATHPNEILKREDIQKHVWQEEGVLVGRSLDVFISRLRKVLKSDPSVVIKNIHGVGYRLEIK